MKDELKKHEKKFIGIDERFDSIEQKITGMDKKVTDSDKKVDLLRSQTMNAVNKSSSQI